MELSYIFIALLILVLPIILTKLLSRKTRKVTIAPLLPASLPRPEPRRTDALRSEVATLLAQGGKMEAIKLMREKKGLPLAAAKEAVETICREEAIITPAPGLVAVIQRAQQMSEEVRRLAANGKKVEAVKLLREKGGLGLKEAKDLVDRLG